MKKILFLLLLISSLSYGQTIAPTKVKITANTVSESAPFVNVQEADGYVNKINKSDLVNVIEATSAATLPVTGVTGKIYLTKDNNKIYRWNGTFYQELAVTDITGKVDKNAPITGATKTKITYDAKGLVTSGTDLVASDIPTIAQSQVTNLTTDLATKVDKVAGKGLSTEDYTTAEKTKLAGIQAGATANSTDAQLRDRTTHTGTQAINTVIGLQAAIDAKINISLIGANNGITPLDAGGKVSFAYLPASLMIYKGMWNPVTNTPTLADGTGVAGWVYKASASGTINLGSGNLVIVANDFIIHNGTKWEWSSGTDAVVSVNGQQGVVTLNTSHIQEVTNKRYQTDAQSTNNNATSPIQQQLDGKLAINGTALNATNWGNRTANFDTVASTLLRLTGVDNADGVVRQVNSSVVQSWLGINNGSTLNNNISGNASSATVWGNKNANFEVNGTSLGLLWGADAGSGYAGRYFLPTQVQTWLGLGSNAYTSTAYLPLVGYSAVSADTFKTSGVYSNNGSGGSYGDSPILVFRSANTAGQLNIDYNTGNLRFRGYLENTDSFTAWRNAWHDGNFNPANYLPLSGGTLNNNLKVSGGYGIGYTLEDGFSITREAGATRFSYGGAAKLDINNSGITVFGSITSPDTGISEGQTAFKIEGLSETSTGGYGSKLSLKTFGYNGSTYLFREALALNANLTATFASSVSATGFFQSSDRRLKYVHKRDGDVAYFTWKDGRDTKTHIGWIAQEVRKQFPDQVQKNEDGYLSVSYIEILVAKNRDLEKKLEALEDRINQLEKSK